MNLKLLRTMAKAIQEIKDENLEKLGTNPSGFKYYTPEQVHALTNKACKNNDLFTRFNLVRDERGIKGLLFIYDISTDAEEDSEPLVYEMTSGVAGIQGANQAQQLGGSMTYTKRYMLMNAFEIIDDNLDPDANKAPEPTKPTSKPWLKKDSDKFKSMVNFIKAGNEVKDVEELFQLSAEVKTLLENIE